MRKFRHTFVLVGLAIGLGGSAAHADIVNTYDRGSYRSSGSHSPFDNSYLVGINDARRNFFAFALPSAPSGQEVISASLWAYTAGVVGDSTVTLRDYGGSIASLTAGGPSGPAGVARYNDLGTGTVFGSRNFTESEDDVFVSYTLNASAIAAINAKLGNDFVIGGRGSSSGAAYFISGSFDPADGNTYLDVTFAPVPAPGAALLGIMGLSLVGLKRRGA